MADKNTTNRIVGITPHKSGKFRIRYWKDGKKHDEYRATNEAALLRLDELTAEFATREKGQKPRRRRLPRLGDGTESGDWLAMIWSLAREILADPTNESIQRAMKAISSGALAAAKFMDDAKLREECEELKALVNEILSARKDGSRISGRTAIVAASARSNEQIC